MKKLFIFSLFLLLLLGGLAQAAERTLKNEMGEITLQESSTAGFYIYLNGRFGFVVEIPEIFSKVVVIPQNDDGIILSTEDDKSSFRTSGGYNLEDSKTVLKESYNSALEELGKKVAYKRLGKDFYVVSWLEDDSVIHYRKYMVSDSVHCDFEMSYPKSEKSNYDALVMHVAKSLTPPKK